ncbi:unnamed protein product [Onchocerca flexuosa]|uniref:Transposase n=1 Tax=Onchocerca flexuosa TaxID=387005 RepID=A0A183HW30_9BILA|nr:unnamed protein product [Onchocerca flexuosa]
MYRNRSNLDYRSHAAEGMRRLIANQTEEDRALVNEQKGKKWLNCEPNDVRPDLSVHACEHVDRVPQL